MNKANTLFLRAQWGLEKREDNLYESRMWELSQEEKDMKFLSLHKSKPQPVYVGGEIVCIRSATKEEIDAHQEWLRESGKGEMKRTKGRKIIVFRPDPEWKQKWPECANKRGYKAIGYIEE